jgi:biotin transport system substrate-specific component
MKTSPTTTAIVRAAGTHALAGIRARRAVFEATLVVAGVAVLTAGAWLSVPFYPVPLTMQTLAVLLVGGLLGPRLGVSAVAGYLTLGLVGAPVFHGGLGGLAVLAGPTGGYLLGFLPAALLMGWVAGRARGAKLRDLALLAAGAMLAGAAIYAMGVPWLALFTGGSLSRAAAVGAAPFLLGDLLKTAVAVGAIRTGRSVLSHRGLLPF